MKNASQPVKIITGNEGEIFDIELSEDLLKKNESLADANRQALDKNRILAIDILGSVGSGKTSLIEQITRRLQGKKRIGMIAGDLTTTIDADRVKRHGAQIIQVNTGKECHLDANLVKRALNEFKLSDIDLLIIENVGNLICPGEFHLGAHKRIVVVSVTEGPYMIIKHPYIFQEAGLAIINKIDLAQAMEVDIKQLEADALKINPRIKVIRTNCRTGEGVDKVIEFLKLDSNH